MCAGKGPAAGGGEKYELPPDFLMEVLKLMKQLMDADERYG